MDEVCRMQANDMDPENFTSVLPIHHLGQTLALFLCQGLQKEIVLVALSSLC